MASARRINPQTFNRYSYVLNNPYRLVDPSGMMACPPDYPGCQTDENGDYIIDSESGDKAYIDTTIYIDASEKLSMPPAAGLVGPPPLIAPPIEAAPVVAPGVGRAILPTLGRAAVTTLLAPAIVIGILAGTAHAPPPTRQPTTTTTDDDGDNSDILYRGVTVGHPGYNEALQGIARPRGGTSDAEEHNTGFTDSIYTSWSHNFSTANWYANSSGQGGVVLTSRIPRSQQTPSIDRFDEGEVLVRGVVTGANVTLIKPR